MKKFGFILSLIIASTLLFTGCGPGSGNAGQSSKTDPVITILGDNPISIGVGDEYIDAGATATDNEDGDLTNSIVTANTVDTSVPGDYTVTYTVTDSDGNTVMAVRNVNVSDQPPVITILGAQNLVIRVGDDYNDPGATAMDDVDGDLTDQIDTNNTVNNAEIGDYTVIYTVSDSALNTTIATRYVTVIEELPPEVIPPDTSSAIEGTYLACDPLSVDENRSDDANETIASEPFKKNVSSEVPDLESRKLQTSHNTMERLGMVMNETSADGTEVSTTKYHPIAINYLEQVGGDYEMGDGSADIGDPNNVDKVVLSLTRDNGKTWKDYTISNTTEKSSIDVVWDNTTIAYPGHAQKPDMAINGQNILIAWNDKYCPSGNPFNLDGNQTDGYPHDVFAVNGPQNYIDYEGIVAPNGKTVYQVPFSCVWTARGIIDPVTADITWHAPIQLTSGARDTNHIWIAASDIGFAISWQEDTIGLKAGEGAGPGEGWSGATGNRGTDIWYTSIKMTDFIAEDGVDIDGKPKSLNNFHYPVRITDNEQCQDDRVDGTTEKKLYCDYFCSNFGTITSLKGNQSGETVTRCLTYDNDMLTDTVSLLDGDTGASRSAIKILKTNLDEYVVVLGYEETKALKVRITGEGEQDQGTIPTDISLEGKSVYFESFNFNAIDDFDESNVSTIGTTAMPLVSAGKIINVRVPDQNTSEMIYENARRLVIGTQIDSCDASADNNLTFAILYKQSFEVQGASSDMFVRTWRGFTYDDKAPLDGRDVTNVSAQDLTTAVGPEDYTVSWSEVNLDDNTYENDRENTFSPRIFLRGENINIGYAYTPYETLDGEKLPGGGIFPSNFHTNLYIDGSWTGPTNVTHVTDSIRTTLDPRFFTTPKGSFDVTGLESDKSNPNVLFVTWGTAIKTDDGMKEENLYFRRSTDNGVTWEDEQILSGINRHIIEEKEVNSYASADGKHIYNVWLQQSEALPTDDNITTGLDTWFGRVDYNISIVPDP